MKSLRPPNLSVLFRPIRLIGPISPIRTRTHLPDFSHKICPTQSNPVKAHQSKSRLCEMKPWAEVGGLTCSSKWVIIPRNPALSDQIRLGKTTKTMNKSKPQDRILSLPSSFVILSSFVCSPRPSASPRVEFRASSFAPRLVSWDYWGCSAACGGKPFSTISSA